MRVPAGAFRTLPLFSRGNTQTPEACVQASAAQGARLTMPNPHGPTDPSAVHPDVRSFVHALRQRHHPAARNPHPGQREEVVRQVAATEDLVDRFSRAATRMGCKLHAADAGDVAACVSRLLSSLGVRTIWLDPALADLRLDAFAATRALRPDTANERDDALFSLDASVAGVTLAIAETGSLLCESGPLAPRGATLMTPLHVAIVRSEQIVPDLADAINALASRPRLPANAVLITGPSKTADVEGVLVTGVHGPREVHVVLVAASTMP